MTLSTFATFLGSIELLVGLPFLFSREKTMAVFRRLLEEEMLLRSLGGVFFALSMLVLLEDRSIGLDVEGLVRFVTWLVAFKALLLCWVPHWIRSLSEWWFSRSSLHFFGAFLKCVVGILLLGAGKVLA
jgi:hypothetical protein